MNKQKFDKKVKKLFEEHNKLIKRKNVKIKNGNGVFDAVWIAVFSVIYLRLLL